MMGLIAFCAILYIVILKDLNVNKKYSYIDEKVYDKALLSKCYYGILSDYLLVIVFNFNMYTHAELLKEIYVDVFGQVLTCGPTSSTNSRYPDIAFDLNKGYFGYHCMALAMERFPNLKGYFYGNDDMIINWWTMLNHDATRIWHGTQVIDFNQHAYASINKETWIWWNTSLGIRACQNYYEDLKSLTQSTQKKSALEIFLANGNGQPRCGKGWADFFYIPHKFSARYKILSHIAYKNRMFLEIAVHNILRSLDLKDNFIVLNGVYLPDHGLADYKTNGFWDIYNHQIAFIHPYKFHADNYHLSKKLFKEKIVKFVQNLMKC